MVPIHLNKCLLIIVMLLKCCESANETEWGQNITKLYELYKNATREDINKPVIIRRMFINDSEYQIHINKLREVNGFKMHNILIKRVNLNANSSIYINNPLEAKLPHPFMSLEEFKKTLMDQRLKDREAFVKSKLIAEYKQWKKLIKPTKKASKAKFKFTSTIRSSTKTHNPVHTIEKKTGETDAYTRTTTRDRNINSANNRTNTRKQMQIRHSTLSNTNPKNHNNLHSFNVGLNTEMPRAKKISTTIRVKEDITKYRASRTLNTTKINISEEESEVDKSNSMTINVSNNTKQQNTFHLFNAGLNTETPTVKEPAVLRAKADVLKSDASITLNATKINTSEEEIEINKPDAMTTGVSNNTNQRKISNDKEKNITVNKSESQSIIGIMLTTSSVKNKKAEITPKFRAFTQFEAKSHEEEQAAKATQVFEYFVSTTNKGSKSLEEEHAGFNAHKFVSTTQMESKSFKDDQAATASQELVLTTNNGGNSFEAEQDGIDIQKVVSTTQTESQSSENDNAATASQELLLTTNNGGKSFEAEEDGIDIQKVVTTTQTESKSSENDHAATASQELVLTTNNGGKSFEEEQEGLDIQEVVSTTQAESKSSEDDQVASATQLFGSTTHKGGKSFEEELARVELESKNTYEDKSYQADIAIGNQNAAESKELIDNYAEETTDHEVTEEATLESSQSTTTQSTTVRERWSRPRVFVGAPPKNEQT